MATPRTVRVVAAASSAGALGAACKSIVRDARAWAGGCGRGHPARREPARPWAHARQGDPRRSLEHAAWEGVTRVAHDSRPRPHACSFPG